MLLWLTELLAKEVRAFNVFGYLTLRAVLACMTALFISFIVGPKVIADALEKYATSRNAKRLKPADALKRTTKSDTTPQLRQRTQKMLTTLESKSYRSHH